MDKSIRILIALLLATPVFGQVESVTVNSATRDVKNTGVVNFATGQLKVNGVVMPPAGGSGDVVGPAGGVSDGQYVLFNGTTGKIIKGGVTTTGIATIGLGGTMGSTPNNSGNWDTGFSERRQWDGGSTNLVAGNGRTNLGGTTVGQNFFTLTNPSAITYPQINADNSVSTLTAASFRTNIGAGTGNGSVTSIATTSPVQGGTITTTGTISLNLGTDFQWTTPQSITLTNTATSTSDTVLQLLHNSSNTPGGGFGTTLWFRLKNSTTTNQDAGQFQCNWTDATAGSEDSYFDFLLRNGGAGLASKARIWNGGGFTVGSTTGTNPGVGVINATGGYEMDNVPLSAGMKSTSTTGQTGCCASDTYVTGSAVTVGANNWTVGGVYHVRFDLSKSAAGTGSVVNQVRIGTAGSTGDTSVLSTGALHVAGTAAADTAIVEWYVTIRSTGASANGSANYSFLKNFASAGFSNSGTQVVLLQNAGFTSTFNSTTATKIGVSTTCGASCNGAIQNVFAEWIP